MFTMNANRKGRARTALAVAAVVAGWAQFDGTPAEAGVPLGAPYKDVFHGFSLRPPAGTERLRERSDHRLVCWVRRDEKTGAIRWSLEVLLARHKPIKGSREEFAQAVAAQLAANRFKVASTKPDTVAGKPAVHFRGMWKGALELWRRQTWVEKSPQEHLVLNIAGPVTAQAAMDAVLDAVAGTLKLFDSTAALAERRENLARGVKALSGLNEAKLRDVLAPEPYYFFLKMKGKVVGFLKVTESIQQRGRTRGVRILRLGAVLLPDKPRRLTRDDLFAAPDREFERWQRIVIDGRGRSAVKSVTEGLKQRDLLVMQVTADDQPPTDVKQRVPEALLQAYLPQAFDVLLPRLVSRSGASAYGFAVYSPPARNFDLRTLSVVGPEKVKLAGRTLPATRLTDKMAEDAPTANLWVDGKGLLVRMETAHGLALERATDSLVKAKFAAEMADLEKIKP